MAVNRNMTRRKLTKNNFKFCEANYDIHSTEKGKTDGINMYDLKKSYFKNTSYTFLACDPLLREALQISIFIK